MKKWIRDSLKSILGGIIFLIILYYLASPFQSCSGTPCYQGLPFEFYKPAGCGSCINCPCYPAELNYQNLGINLLILSLVMFLLLKIIGLFKEKKGNIKK
jgi:hypothetical protein